VCELYQGKFTSSLGHCEAALASHEPGRNHLASPGLSITDREVSARSISALSLFALGWPDRALARTREAIALARRIGHPYSLAYALVPQTILHWLRREVSAQRERAAEAIALSESHGFRFWLGLAGTWHAAARVAAGEPEAVADLMPGLAQSGGTGSRAGAPAFFAVIGRAYLSVGQLSEARVAVGGGLALAAQTGQPFYDAELQRLQGELVLAAGGAHGDAEAFFHRALEIARAQEARSFELSAATSLARLWQQQGKKDEARDLLAPVYDWFTEGFDTQDLKDAKALLKELA
jgi:predicted ATPase